MKQRLLYIDVLRGIAILIVIYSHILLFCVGYSETSALTNLLRLYFLNGFFFHIWFYGLQDFYSQPFGDD